MLPKGTSQAEVTLNSENIKPIALAIVKLRLSEGIISQLLSHSVSKTFCLNIFFENSVATAVWVHLKACLGFVLPNQYCLIII